MGAGGDRLRGEGGVDIAGSGVALLKRCIRTCNARRWRCTAFTPCMFGCDADKAGDESDGKHGVQSDLVFCHCETLVPLSLAKTTKPTLA